MCNAVVTPAESCNHAVCKCTAEFCTACGRKWKTCNSPGFKFDEVPNHRSALRHGEDGQSETSLSSYMNEKAPSKYAKKSRPMRHPLSKQKDQFSESVKATAEDAIKAGISPNCSLKSWDPTESPILLLGSVFDANSLGKYIYDWTVSHRGKSTPSADIAGDLWLLLIKVAGRLKRAEAVQIVRSKDNQEMIEDFIESGRRLWDKFKKLLKVCDKFVLSSVKREYNGKITSIGRDGGTALVDSIFGRDRELINTEKVMSSMRLWIMRFDANCEDILRRPLAPETVYSASATTDEPIDAETTVDGS